MAREATDVEAAAITTAREIVLRESAALCASVLDLDEAAIEADSTLLGAAIAKAIIDAVDTSKLEAAAHITALLKIVKVAMPPDLYVQDIRVQKALEYLSSIAPPNAP